MIAPIAAVTAVVVVVLLLIVINSRPEPKNGGPALTAPAASVGTTTTVATSPSVAPPAASSAASAPAPPVSEPPATQAPAATKVPVSVLNNSRRAGLAREVANEVQAKGWPVGTVGNFTGRIAETTVYYDSGQLESARALANDFPQIKRIAARFAGLPGSGLTLVVTRDWN
jgi:hypothetical protein